MVNNLKDFVDFIYKKAVENHVFTQFSCRIYGYKTEKSIPVFFKI